MRVYIAGPYTQGDVAENIRQVIYAAEQVREAGHVPFVPHLYHLWHLISPQPPEYWRKLDIDWLVICHAFIKLDGDSKGADLEEDLCSEINIPIYYTVKEFLNTVLLDK